jgi:hypothetical protein
VRRGRGQEGGAADHDARVPSIISSLIQKTRSCESTGPENLSRWLSLSLARCVSRRPPGQKGPG